jgi:mycothiol synthase
VILPAGFTSRPATADDIETVVELFRVSDLAISGDVEPRREFFRWVWGLPYVDLERHTVLVHHGDQAVAYCQSVRDPNADEDQRSEGRVLPDWERRGLGDAFVTWTERLATERLATERLTARGDPFKLRLSCDVGHASARALYERRGYAHVRTSWDMGRELKAGEVAIPPPDGITIRTFEIGRDERTFHRVSNDAFAEHWGSTPTPYESFAAQWWGDAESDPPKILLAEEGGRAVGECAWIVFETGGYVASIGVLKDWRGRGIAQALLCRAMADMARLGHRDVFLSVDSENATGAVRLYDKVGMRVRRRSLLFEKAPGPA